MAASNRTLLLALLAFIFALFLGFGRNLPYQAIYPFGVAPAEFLCVFLILFLVIKQKVILEYQAQRLFGLVLMLGLICLASIFVNAFGYGVALTEVFEVFRYILLAMIPIIMRNYFYSCQKELIEGFIIGLIISVVFAVLNPMNPDILGVFQIYNPNVIGYVLVYGAWLPVLGYLLYGEKRYAVYFCVMILASMFTFSKGAWLCVVFLLIALVFYFLSALSFRRLLLLICFLVMIVVVDSYFIGFVDKFSEIIVWKLAATDFEATAAEGGSFSARAGLAISGLLITLEHPLLGVGLSNFQLVHDSMAHQLGDLYYEDDNPNNVFLYLSSGAGVFALIVWISILVLYFLLVYRVFLGITQVSKLVNLLMVLCFVAVTIIGGVTQNEMLNAFYFWFYFGLFILLNEGIVNDCKNSAN